jgi:hypothetical protein
MRRGMVGSFNGIEGGAERMGWGTVLRRGGQAAQSIRLPWVRRSRSELSRWRRLQLLREEEGEGVFLLLYIFGSGRRKAKGHQRGGRLLGLEVEWACYYGGEIKEKE